MRHVLPLVSLLALSTPALAQTVDATGAAALQDALSRYVGKTAFEKGIIKVGVDGDAYKLDVDFKALLGLLPAEAKMKADVAPYALRVKPRADGDWDVSGDMAPNGKFEFAAPDGQQQLDWTINGGKFEGVYDPDLATFSSATGSYTDLKMVSVDAISRTNASTGPSTFTMTGSAAPAGGVDISSKQSMEKFEETVAFTAPDMAMPFPIVLKSSRVDVDATGTGVRTKPMLDLLAFFVENSEEAKIKANQAQLKTLLLALLPVWDNVAGSYNFNEFLMPSPLGDLGAAKLGVDFDIDGIGTGKSLDYGFEMTGLKLPPQAAQFAPAWAISLAPTDLDLNLGITNLNLEGISRKAIESMDLNMDPPLTEQVRNEIQAEFMGNMPKIIMNPSTIKNADTQFSMQGDLIFVGGNTEKPEMNATIDATGYDKMVEVLQKASATDPQAQQAFPVALAVKGFGKTLPDGRLQWVVNVKADGSVMVNGGMIKGPDPVMPIPAPEPLPQPTDPNAPPGTLTNPSPN